MSSSGDARPAGDGSSRGARACARLRRPWCSRTIWIGLLALVAWSVLCGVLLNVDLTPGGRHDDQADPWIWGLLILVWVGALVRYAMACVTAQQADPPGATHNVDYELWLQAYAMAHFAMQRGRTPEDRDLVVVQQYSPPYDWADDRARCGDRRVAALTATHRRLSRLVAPAMPKTIVLLSAGPRDPGGVPSLLEQPESLSWLGNVRVARMMLGLAVALLPVFVTLALYKGTSLDDVQALSDGAVLDKAATAAYLIVASALGASFAALFKVRKYIENLNYDDQYESSYWVRFVLGLVAGLILAIPLASLLPSDAETQFKITVPILALVGGFSSDLVYRILKRILDAVEALLVGSASEAVQTEARVSEARVREVEARAHESVTVAESRTLAREMATLLSLLDSLPDDEEVVAGARAAIRGRLRSLVAQDDARDGTQDDARDDARDDAPAAAER